MLLGLSTLFAVHKNLTYQRALLISSSASEAVEHPPLILAGGEKRDRRLVNNGKLEKNNKNSSENEEQQLLNGAFIHFGKTGGSTLSLLLRNGCHSFIKKPCREVANETVASKLIEFYYHVPDFGDLPNKNHSFYLVTLRDPFDRTKSAFAAQHPANDLARGQAMTKVNYNGRTAAFRCFPSLEAFADLLGDDPTNYDYPYSPNQLIQKNCTNFARASLDGKVRRFNHWYFSYRKIRSLLPQYSPATIYATRKENLAEDWNRVNQLLGEPQEAKIPEQAVARNYTGMRLPTTRDLSEGGRRRLCKALQSEYDYYMSFLWQAVNLKEDQVREAVEYSKQNCPGVNYLSREEALALFVEQGIAQ